MVKLMLSCKNRRVYTKYSNTKFIKKNKKFVRFTPYNQQGNYNSYRSPMSSPPRTKRETPPRLPSKKHRSQSLTPSQGQGSNRVTGQDKYCSADGVIQGEWILYANKREFVFLLWFSLLHRIKVQVQRRASYRFEKPLIRKLFFLCRPSNKNYQFYLMF